MILLLYFASNSFIFKTHQSLLMKRINKVLIIIISCLISITNIQAQRDSSKTKISLSTDIMNRYVWRGASLSTAPIIQPSLNFQVNNFTIGAFGSYSINRQDLSETDLFVSYSFMEELFSLTVTDYFFPAQSIPNNKYFNYSKNETGHIFEGAISFNGIKNIPFFLMIATNFYGADAKKINSESTSSKFNQSDGNQFSTYIELGYSFIINDTELNTFLGFNLNKPKEANSETGYIGETGFYGNTMGVVNLGLTASKYITISKKYSLPIQTSLIINPMAENIFIVCGISF